MYIYKITNKLNGKCYIGQTCNVVERFANHKCCIESSIGRAIIEFGECNFTFEVLLKCNQRDANLIESCLIIEYDSIRNGYNKILSKKYSNLDFNKAERIVDEILAGNYIYTNEDMSRSLIDERSVICIDDDIIFDNALECRKFYNICSTSHIREVCEGKRATANGKHFRYITDDGDFIVEPSITVKEHKSQVFVQETNCIYSSISEACKCLNLNYRSCVSAISKCLKGERVTAFGYHWSYYDGVEAINTGRINGHCTKVIMDLDSDYVFDSTKEAVEFLGVKSHSPISVCLRGKSGSAYGHTWNLVRPDGTIVPNSFSYSSIDRSKVKRFEIVCDGKYTYKSLAKAAEALGLNSNSAKIIAKVCKGELKEAFGHTWSYGKQL